MTKMSKLSLSAILSSHMFLAFAAPASIGIVQSAGEFRVANSAVFGNGTIFEGDRIESAAWSAVDLPGHGRVRLGPASRADIYRKRTVLHSGTGVVQSADRHAIEAGLFRISPANRDSVVQVELTSPGMVAVSARSGFALVHSQAGVLLASVRPGLALSLGGQGGAGSSLKMTGTIQKSDDKFLLTDEDSKTVVELKGQNLASYSGKRVTIIGAVIPGAVAAAGAAQVVSVTTVSVLGAAAVAGGAAAGAGLALGAKVAIVAIAAGAASSAGYAVATDSSPE